MLDFFNDTNRQDIQFKDATAKMLGGPMGAITRPQLVIPKTDIVALYIDDAGARANIHLLRRIERCILYLPGLVCRAEVHMGAETRWQDALDLMPNDFFGATAAMAYPLAALPGPFPQQTDLLMLNRRHVKMFHVEPA